MKKNLVETLARRYGEPVEAGEARFWAFLLPQGGGSPLEGVLTPTGRLEERRWAYWGPAQGGGEALRDGDRLTSRGRSFEVRNMRDHRLGGQVFARAGTLIPLDEDWRET